MGSGKRSTCSDVEDGAIGQGYGSTRGSIPEGRWEVASLVVVVLHTHYGSELGDGGHPARALGLRGRPCRQCVTSVPTTSASTLHVLFFPGGSVTTGEEGERDAVFFRSGERVIV